MSEQQVIQNTKEPITKEKIIYELFNLGISSKDTVLLHSSLSAIGYVIGKEMTVVDAFLEVLDRGTLVMPSQTGDNSDPTNWSNPPVPKEWVDLIKIHTPSYNKNTFSTRSMGKIVECFRHYKGVKRSNHPQVSFIAKGVNARYIIKKHGLSPMFGMSSPLGKLYTINAKVVLLGVGYDSATVFHLAEILSNTATEELQGTKWKEKWIEYQDYSYNTDDFIKLGNALAREGFVKNTKIGNAKTLTFNVRESVDFAVTWFEKTRKQKTDN